MIRLCHCKEVRHICRHNPEAQSYADPKCEPDPGWMENPRKVRNGQKTTLMSYPLALFFSLQTGIGHSSFSSGVSSFGLELIFETIIPVQVTTTTQRYIPIPNAHVR